MGLTQQQFFPIEQIKVQKHQNRKNNNQYFTPEFAVEKAISFIPDSKIENIIDPAVGNGAFLKIAIKKWEKIKLFGIDIDRKVVEDIEKSNFQNANFFYGNALLQETWQNREIQNIISDGGFDLVAGNPQFSSWCHRIVSSKILSNYKLAHRNGKLMRSQAIEVLFLEIVIKLCKYNGFVIIVLPEGILSNLQHKYIRGFILKETELKYIISLPRNVFEDTSAKTSILVLQKKRKVASDYLHILRVNGIDPYFLTIYLKTKYGKQVIELLKHGVGTVSINKSDIYSIPIPIVSDKIQESIKIRYKNILKYWVPSIYTADGYENEIRYLIKDLEKTLEDYNCGKYVEG